MTTLFKLSSFIWLDVIIEYITAGYWTAINILALTSSPNKLWNSLAYKSSFADCSILVMYNIHVTSKLTRKIISVCSKCRNIWERFLKKNNQLSFFPGPTFNYLNQYLVIYKWKYISCIQNVGDILIWSILVVITYKEAVAVQTNLSIQQHTVLSSNTWTGTKMYTYGIKTRS